MDGVQSSAAIRVAEFPERLLPLRERLLANLVMIGQTPAPTGDEAQRVQLMLDRFDEARLPEVEVDEFGNAVGTLPGTRGDRTIAVVAHLDSIFPATVDHNVRVERETIVGPGVGDNAVGAAVVSMLPTILESLGIRLAANLVLLGSTRSMGRGNHEGIRLHLDKSARQLDFGIVVEGMQLGRLNYFSIGALRGDIVCDVPAERAGAFGAESALVAMNQISNGIMAIGVPNQPATRIRLGKIRAGVGYDTNPDHAVLGIEVISNSDEILARIRQDIEDVVAEMSAHHAVEARTDFFFSRPAVGIPFSHPLVRAVVNVMRELDIEPDQTHEPSELAEFISREIPAVTLGVTRGLRGLNQPDHVMIEPILKGVAQLLGVILAIDEGACDVD